MPRFDRTGPLGVGSMTGGGRDLCNPRDAGYNDRFTAGFGDGRGLGQDAVFEADSAPTGAVGAVSAEATPCCL